MNKMHKDNLGTMLISPSIQFLGNLRGEMLSKAISEGRNFNNEENIKIREIVRLESLLYKAGLALNSATGHFLMER